MVDAHQRAQISLDSKIPSVTPPSTSRTLTYTHWTTVLTNNDSTGPDESQLQGKWGWASHHHSESTLPSPRLRQDHLWSMPTRGHKSRLIPRYPVSPHPPHPGPWPTRTGLRYWLTTIQQGQMNPSCRESEAGHHTITRNPHCPVQDCGRTTYGRCPPEGTNLTGYPASPYHPPPRTQAYTHWTTSARLNSRQTTPRRTDTDINDIIRTKVKQRHSLSMA